MKKRIGAAVFLLCLILLTGCHGNSPANVKAEPDTSPAAETKTAMLWVGTTQSDLRSYPWDYTDELTAEKLAEGLSQLTGLDFLITAGDTSDGITVDWADDSTLIAGLDDREQKEDFHFYDADSMRWFMMDSLQKTLANNMAVENVYYTMNEGQALTFDELSPVREFPAELPYMGSTFYFEHADGGGDLIDMESDPGDTNQPAWWGTYKSDELGFSVIITEYSGTDFWAEVSLLRSGSIVLAAKAAISPEDDHFAVFGDFDLSFRLSEDFSAVDIEGAKDSEWAHMCGHYMRIE